MVSTYEVEAHTQADGRRYVNETHTDVAGGVHTLTYLADAGADYAAILAEHASQLEGRLADAEFNEVLNGD